MNLPVTMMTLQAKLFSCSSTVGGTPDTVIDFALVNDGTEDCGDGSDEPQDFDGDGAVDNWFDCNDDESTTVSMNVVNDGSYDCPNAADEPGLDVEIEGDMPFPSLTELHVANLMKRITGRCQLMLQLKA